jgi:hypothetical protein
MPATPYNGMTISEARKLIAGIGPLSDPQRSECVSRVMDHYEAGHLSGEVATYLLETLNGIVRCDGDGRNQTGSSLKSRAVMVRAPRGVRTKITAPRSSLLCGR